MPDLPSLLEALPTRVRRNYRGGALLGAWTGAGGEGDGDRPEEWIASTVRAVNPGLPPVDGEGLTRVRGPRDGETSLAARIAEAPAHYLGEAHFRERGGELGFLAKLLDSAMRLHVQAHPTSAFAQAHLGSRYGKMETYLILAARPGFEPYLRLGFQRAPAPEEWGRIVADQDKAAMDACFDRVPVRVGEVWHVPGGLPHAIGEGVLMLEVMEPSDWVVRCEFEREGIVVPPAGRFMGRDLDFCLRVFDYRSYSVDEIARKCRREPRPLREGPCGKEEELIGAAQTECFAVRRLRLTGPARLSGGGRLLLLLVTEGEGRLEAGGETAPLWRASRWIVPAATGEVVLCPRPGTTLETIACFPGASDAPLLAEIS